MTWSILTPWELGDVVYDTVSDFAEITTATEYVDQMELEEDIPKFDAIVASSTSLRMPADRLRRATNLKMISSVGVGLDSVDIPVATEEGILVCNNPGKNTRAVAEHTIGLLLAARKSIRTADRDLRDGIWERRQYRAPELGGRTMGVYGCGNIGTLVSEFAHGLGLDSVAYDPYVDPATKPEWLSFVESPRELFETADMVGIHAPLTDETRGTVGRDELEALGPDGILVNTGRGPIVDEAALIDALKSNTIQAAGIDVFEEEPTPEDNPLFDLDNVVVTPHMAGTTNESGTAKDHGIADNLKTVYDGRVPDSTVNLDQLCVQTVYDGHAPDSTPASRPFGT